MNQYFALSLSLLLLLPVASVQASELPHATLDAKHRNFFKDNCLACHNAEKQEGKVRLDNLSFTVDSVEQADVWQKVLNSVNAGEMPPEDEKQPQPADKTDFLEALSQTLVTARRVLSDSGGKIVVRRLNRREYANTIHDLLGVQIDVSNLPPDSGNGTFDTVGSSLFMSSDQVEQYLTLGRQALQDAHARQAAGAKPLKIRSEVEIVANAQIRSAMDIIKKRSEPARQWFAAVDAASTKAENVGHAADLRKIAEKEVKKYSFYRHWAEIKGAPSPTTFGFKDAFAAIAAQGEYEETNPYQQRYLELPQADKGIYLFIFRLRHEEKVTPDRNWPPGRYTLRVRIAALDDTPPERRFIELGRPAVPGAFDILSTHHVTGSMAEPQVIEMPVTITSTDERSFSIREKRLNSREAEVGIWVRHVRKYNDWLPPSMWIDWIELEGPLPSESKVNLASAQTPRKIIADFTERAFRGAKPDAAFIDGLVAVYDKRRAAGDTHPQALQEAMSIVLAAPGFLYLGEPSQPGKTRPLTHAELASRLSYFLWSAPPDDALLQADLNEPEVFARQVDRLIASPKSREFVTGFLHQWLGLDRLDFFRFNAKMFPQFDDSAKMAARQEVFETFAYLLHNNSSLTHLLKSDRIVINGLLANLYGIDGVHGDAFRPVTLPHGSPRGGLLGMAAIMAMGSNGEHTSPVERGAWVLRKLLHNPPPPAPPNVPQLSRLADEPLSPRERILAHQEEPQCLQCHRKIDPIGFGLENFDTIGQWRSTEVYTKASEGRKDWPIDPSGKFHNGPAFKDYFQLRDLIAAQPENFARGFTESLIEYALGRPYGFADASLADDIVRKAKAKDFAMKEFLLALVTSPEFGRK
jgi:hypothetical protein